jgi:hypothetical protein
MAEQKPKASAADKNDNVVVVDIGKKYRRKHIRRLRKGRGKLMDRVENLVAGLRDEKAIDANAQPVVIIVREKSKKSRFPW